MHRFVHVGFVFAGVPKIRDLEPVMTTIGDWVRYSPLSWLVWTDKPLAEIYLVLQRYVDAHDQMLITGMNPQDAFGRLSPWIWNWINSKTAT